MPLWSLGQGLGITFGVGGGALICKMIKCYLVWETQFLFLWDYHSGCPSNHRNHTRLARSVSSVGICLCLCLIKLRSLLISPFQLVIIFYKQSRGLSKYAHLLKAHTNVCVGKHRKSFSSAPSMHCSVPNTSGSGGLLAVWAPVQEMLLGLLGCSYLSEGGIEPASQACPGGGAADHSPSFHLQTWLWLG